MYPSGAAGNREVAGGPFVSGIAGQGYYAGFSTVTAKNPTAAANIGDGRCHPHPGANRHRELSKEDCRYLGLSALLTQVTSA